MTDFTERQSEALTNQRVKSLIDFDEEYSSSIKSVAIQKSEKVNLTTRFLNGKTLMFNKLSIVYDLIHVFLFPNEEIKKIYKIYKAEFWQKMNVQRKELKKQVDLFEIENIDTPNIIITIALNPKEYYERFHDHSDNKKHKGLKKSTRGMDFDSYSERLADLTEFSKEFLRKPVKIEQKRFQVINDSMQMKSVIKIQFGKLNDKRFYFSNGLISLPFGHPYLEELRKEKQRHRAIHKVIQEKKYDFLKEESKVLQNHPRLNVLKIFSQNPMLYELNSTTKFISTGWKSTNELIKNGRWK